MASGDGEAKESRGPTLQEIPRDDFPKLVQILNDFAPNSLCVQGYILQNLANKSLLDCRVYVDQWPGTPEVVVLEILSSRRFETATTLLPICGFARCDKLKLKQIVTCDPRLNLHFGGKESSEFTGSTLHFLKLGQEVPGSIINIQCDPSICALMDPSRLMKCDCPDGYHLASLKKEHVPFVDKTWTYGGCALSYKRISNIIEQNSITAGIYKGNDLVSFVLVTECGSLGMLETLPPHRGKGLAKALIYHVAQKLLSIGRIPFCLINKENEASQQLFRKMGFEYYRNCSIVVFEIVPETNN